ncbi:MAG: class B sortase [Clostridia bacterium]
MNDDKKFNNSGNEFNNRNRSLDEDDFFDNYIIAETQKAIKPKKRRLDENGNPIPPKKRRLDENGNPIPPKKRRLDENGNPIPPKKKRPENPELLVAAEETKTKRYIPADNSRNKTVEKNKKHQHIEKTAVSSANKAQKNSKRSNNSAKKKSNIVSNIFLGVFGAVFAVSLYMIISYYYTSFQEQASFNELSDFIKNASENIDYDNLDLSNLDIEYTDEVEEIDPQIAIDASILAAYQSLHEENNDMVGWIQIEGTNINYPVMLTENDPEYYIHRSFDDEYSYAGTPFIGEGATVSPNSDHMVIYAHHMKDGSMFADLMDYARVDGFWQEHTEIIFDTLDERAVYELYGIYAIDVSVSNGHYDFYNQLNFDDESSFNSFLENMDRYSITDDINTTAEYGDQFISLVTCSYFSDNGRLVVLAKKVTE